MKHLPDISGKPCVASGQQGAFHEHGPAHGSGGFTVIEVILIVLLIGVLAAVAIPRISVSSKTAKINSCQMNRSTINKQVELFFAVEGTWPEDSMSDIKSNVSYFPDGVPTCPVDLTSYRLEPSPVNRVIGHRKGAGTHFAAGAAGGGGGWAGLSNMTFDSNLNGWAVTTGGAGSVSWSPLNNNSSHFNVPAFPDSGTIAQALTQPLSAGAQITADFFVQNPTSRFQIDTRTGGGVLVDTTNGNFGAGWQTLTLTLGSDHPAGYQIEFTVLNVPPASTGDDVYLDSITITP